MDAEIAALEAKLARYRQIKQGMMHNLLTGRIRLIWVSANPTQGSEEPSRNRARFTQFS